MLLDKPIMPYIPELVTQNTINHFCDSPEYRIF